MRWRRFFLVVLGTAAGLGAIAYAFIVTVDPWDSLPLSPPWPRAPMSVNQRFSYPSLARSDRFDSVVLGTSTSRLLRPEVLNRALGGAFANLAMDAATPHEQSKIAAVFARHHPGARTVLVGLDLQWCEQQAPALYTFRIFPEWLYGDHRWRRYRHMFSLYALTEAFAQLGYMTGFRQPRFGLDGYANFLWNDRSYDAARAALKLGGPLPPPGKADILEDRPELRFPALPVLKEMVVRFPASTRKILFFAPLFLGNRPAPGTPGSAPLAACKRRVAHLAESTPNTVAIDFMIDSPITRNPVNYWDPLHSRIHVADSLIADVAFAAATPPAAQQASPDYRLLTP